MRAIVFDAGPIISLTSNNLLWLLRALHVHYGGDFFVSKIVQRELIEKPLLTKKYKFEALQLLPYFSDGTLKVLTNKAIQEETERLLKLANSIYYAKDHPIQILHSGEVEALALYRYLHADAFIIDERATRMLIEEPQKLARRLHDKLHTHITLNEKALQQFLHYVKEIKILRSVELVTVAYELGLLDNYMARENEIYIRNIKRTLIEAVLWGVKLNGCAVNEEEINEIINLEKNYHRKK